MTHKPIPRRGFLAGAGAATVGALAGSHQANSQITALQPPATPMVRPGDTIFKNGNIVTVDPASSVTRAIAIAGERIIAVGPDGAMDAHAGPQTHVIDLKGKTVIPGLTDGHAHMDREAL